MQRRRLRRANLFGAAGYVSADDGEVIEFSQQGARQHPDGASVVELGGTDTAALTEHTVTETLIRSMYAYCSRRLDVCRSLRCDTKRAHRCGDVHRARQSLPDLRERARYAAVRAVARAL